jgi:simple sugar transport system substrate-binding protein
MKHHWARFIALLIGVMLITAGSGAQALGQDDGERSDLRFVVVTHGQASDPYWSVVQNGVNQAAQDMGVQVEYQAPDTFDMVAMAQLIDAAVASQPDGMAISIPDADALGDSIQGGIDAGIPMVSLDSGSDVAADLGMLTHVGQTEYEAGLAAGQRMGEAGVTTALCINQEVGNVALEDRCRGFTDGLGESGGTVEVLEVDLNNPTEAQARVEAASSPWVQPAPRRRSRRCAAPTNWARSSLPPLTSRRMFWKQSSVATCSSLSIRNSTCKGTCRSYC